MRKRQKKALLSAKTAEPVQLSDVEVDQLRKDLSNQLKVRSIQDAAQIVPDAGVQQGLIDIVDKGDSQQTRQGLLQGAKEGLLGAGIGAATGGLSQGVPGVAIGLLSGGAPAAMHGYRAGKAEEQEQQMRGLLAQKYQGEPPPKVAARRRFTTGELFEVALDELREARSAGELNSQGIKDVLEDLKKARASSSGNFPTALSQKENEVLMREFGPMLRQNTPNWQKSWGISETGQSKKPGVLGKPAPKGPLVSKAPGFFRTVVKEHPKSLAIAGGLAALATLGITAAKLQEYRKKQRQ